MTLGDLLRITPKGHISTSETSDSSDATASLDADARKALRAFESSQAAGLFALANVAQSSGLPPALRYWHDFAGQYLSALCLNPEVVGQPVPPVDVPSAARLAQQILSVPPMSGAEYLTADVLTDIWTDLDVWVRHQIEESGKGLAEFLKTHAPRWHQVGRVCFHLAENKRDPRLPFAFLATYVPGVSGLDRVRYQPLGKALQEYAGAHNKPALVRLLAPVQRAAEGSPFIKELVDSGDLFHPLAWTPGSAYRFLKEVPLYEESGIVVRLPDWWQKRSRPRVGMVIGDKKRTTLGADALLDFKVTLALGDERLTADEFRKLLEGEDGLVLLKGRWVEVDREKLDGALEHWKRVEQATQDGGVTFIEGMRMLAGAPADLTDASGADDGTQEWSFVRAGKWLDETLQQLRNPQHADGVSVGADLRATLREYQTVGVDWLWLMSNLGLGACLADDMGLGKTIQVLGLLLLLKKKKRRTRKPSLLVLPASLLSNWKAEIEKFAPSLRAKFVHTSETDKATLKQFAKSPESCLADADIVLTTYGMLQKQKWLQDVDWQLVILDEAQAIKNPGTRQTRAVKKLRAEARIALTGTPVENRLSDLWSLFDFLCPGLLGSAKQFKDFVKVLNNREHDRYTPLRNLVSPYILRRLKTDKSIIADLPDKSEVKAFCGLTKRQAALYGKSVDEMAAAIKDTGNDTNGIKRRGMVLSYLMRFKQICNHPSQMLGDGEYRSDESGKFARLAEICEEIASRQEKVLVFTQFREMTDPLHAELTRVFGRPGLVLHGGTAVKKRRALVEDFQSDTGPPFFILSLKAGGTGLNLTAASHVIHFDRWWNPAVENQATDRAFRIGQLRNVLVHKFVCRGTIEERIDSLIEEKKSLASDLLEGGAEKMLTEMSNEQLIELVSLDVNKAIL